MIAGGCDDVCSTKGHRWIITETLGGFLNVHWWLSLTLTCQKHCNKIKTPRHAIELNGKTFQKALDDYEALIVDFHSPRCIHCVRFAPIFEHAADLVQQRAPKRRDSHRKHAVALATVDCIENFELCRAQHIQAYPTVLVFRFV